jgi:hypothetical protein
MVGPFAQSTWYARCAVKTAARLMGAAIKVASTMSCAVVPFVLAGALKLVVTCQQWYHK